MPYNSISISVIYIMPMDEWKKKERERRFYRVRAVIYIMPMNEIYCMRGVVNECVYGGRVCGPPHPR
jgi:hypothetical protein